MEKQKRVLVAGASGYLGRFVVQVFKQRGYWVRVLVRNPAKLGEQGPFLEPAIAHLADETVVAEITRPETLVGICETIDIVFSSIGITRQRDGLTHMAVDYQGNKNLLDEAIKAGVETFGFVSVFKADQIDGLADPRERFIEALKESSLRTVIIRPNGYFSDMSEFLKMARSGRVFVIGPGTARINPIHGHDLAEVCVDGVETPGQLIERDVGGPQIYSYREIGALAGEVIGNSPRVVKVPIWLVKAAGLCIRPFSSNGYRTARFFATVMTGDFVAPHAGEQSLAYYFKELAPSV